MKVRKETEENFYVLNPRLRKKEFTLKKKKGSNNGK